MRVFRRNYLVNPRLQLPLIVGANVLALISAGLIVVLNAYTRAQLQDQLIVFGLTPNHPYAGILAQQVADYAQMCVVVGIIQFLLFNGAAIFLSHRIAGPLYRLEHHLQEVGDGKAPDDVKFRQGDLYQPLAEACNTVMARLRESSGKP